MNHGVSPSHDVVSTDRYKLTDTQTIKKKLSRPISVCCYNVCTHHKCLLICFFFTESLAPSVKTESNSSSHETHAQRIKRNKQQKLVRAVRYLGCDCSRYLTGQHHIYRMRPGELLSGSKQEREPRAACLGSIVNKKEFSQGLRVEIAMPLFESVHEKRVVSLSMRFHI